MGLFTRKLKITKAVLECPFCGVTPTPKSADNAPGWVIIECENLDCEVKPSINYESYGRATRAWNRRAPTVE